MAKQRKVGGVQKIGFYRVKKYSGRNEDAYLKRVYETNKNLFDQAFADEKKKVKKEKDKRAIERFNKAYPNVLTWIKKTVQNTIRTASEDMSFSKGLKEAIRLSFTSPVSRFKLNIVNGLKSFGLYEDFMLYINEEFNPERLSYADGNYIYKTEGGKRVLIDVHNSPYSMDLRVIGEAASRVLGEKNNG